MEITCTNHVIVDTTTTDYYSCITSTSTDSGLYMNGFSYGDSIIILFLLIFITVYIFDVVIRNIAGNKISQPLSRVIQGNNSKDGKETYTI